MPRLWDLRPGSRHSDAIKQRCFKHVDAGRRPLRPSGATPLKSAKRILARLLRRFGKARAFFCGPRIRKKASADATDCKCPAKDAGALRPAKACGSGERRVNPEEGGGSLPTRCYIRRKVETGLARRCRKVRVMENDVRRAPRTSAPFGWKASGLQALPAGLFFCRFQAYFGDAPLSSIMTGLLGSRPCGSLRARAAPGRRRRPVALSRQAA